MIKFTNRKRDNIYEETCALHKFYSIKFNNKNISGMLCVEGRRQRSVGEVSRKGIHILACCSLTPFSLSPVGLIIRQ